MCFIGKPPLVSDTYNVHMYEPPISLPIGKGEEPLLHSPWPCAQKCSLRSSLSSLPQSVIYLLSHAPSPRLARTRGLCLSTAACAQHTAQLPNLPHMGVCVCLLCRCECISSFFFLFHFTITFFGQGHQRDKVNGRQ